jgi:pimeloyl-ACP methyl ester carboxylesterase
MNMNRRNFVTTIAITGTALMAQSALAQSGATPEPADQGTVGSAVQSGYSPVNGLEMYYEIHGEGGTPLVLLHGAYMNIDANWAELLPTLAQSRQVIAVETQGHGRTADIDRPITYEAMADDIAALLDYLHIEVADLYGYSMCGGTAFQVAIRHPHRVRKLVAGSVPISTGGMHPGMTEMLQSITPASFAGTPIETEYQRLAPNPGDFPALVEKLKTLDLTPYDWPAATIEGIPSPTLLIFGDSDVVTLEHAVEIFQLRGGGVNGDLAGLPVSQLAVLPGSSHIGVMYQSALLLAIVPSFLDTPLDH